MMIETITKLIIERRWEVATFVDKDSGDWIIGILERDRNDSMTMLMPIGYKAEDYMKSTHSIIAVMACSTIEKVTFACGPEGTKQGMCFYGRLLVPMTKKDLQ